MNLQRTTFRTSRQLDFCSVKELVAQTGHAEEDWPLVVLKELLDNSLDACEEAGIAPDLSVRVDGEGITVADNGPGIPPDTIEGVLDFGVRTSSREAYVSPCRGAQGNALKTIVAMPYVLDGERGRVDVAARGLRHEITMRVDRVEQRPVILHRPQADEKVKTGTSVTVYWPDSARSQLDEAEPRFYQIADDYTFLNPHLSLSVEWSGEPYRIEASDPTWRKWRPSEPTCPLWYRGAQFERLVAAYITHDTQLGQDRTVRDLVGEFRGFSGSRKKKAVLDETGLARNRLSELAEGHELKTGVLHALLKTLQGKSKPVDPALLGAIGETHLARRFEHLGCAMKSFRYRKARSKNADVPWIVEAAFAWCPANASRRLVTGVNWSPGIENPFRRLGTSGESLSSLLQECRAGPREPVAVLLHVACPRVDYTDRGKSALVIGDPNGG